MAKLHRIAFSIVSSRLHRFEVKVIVATATWIEPDAAIWTLIRTFQIFPNAQLCPAASAQHCWLIPFAASPNLGRVIRKFIMAILADIVDATTLHPDGNDIQRSVVMRTSCL